MSRALQFPEGFFDTDFASAARHAASPRECVRLSGLALLQKRLPVKRVAETFNVTKDAVHDWLSRFRRKGIEGVKDQKGQGVCQSRQSLRSDDRETVSKEEMYK